MLPPLHKLDQSDSDWSRLWGEHILIAFYLDLSLENGVYFFGGLRGIVPRLPFTFIGVLGNGNSQSRLTFFRLARLMADGLDLPCPLPRPPGFLEPLLSEKLSLIPHMNEKSKRQGVLLV